MNDTRDRWLAEAFALLLPILVVASPFLFTPRVLRGRDFEAAGRSRALYAREMNDRHGEWPRWNDRQYAGTPFLGDLHGSLHYPPNLLFLALPPERALGWLFVFHMTVAAIGLYRLCRYFEFRRSASVLGGLAYGVCFSAAVHMDEGSLGHFVTPALAPWVLLLVLRMMKRASIARLALLAVAGGAVLLGGNPQDLPPLLILCAGLIAWTKVDAGRRKRPWKASSIVVVAASGILAVALASATLLPAIEVVNHAATAAAPTGVARDWRIVYAGVLPALLALLPFQSPRRGPALYFALAAVAAALPPLLFPRVPVCSLWVVALSISGLAAMGWDGLTRGRYKPRDVDRILMVAGGLAIIAAGVVYVTLGLLGTPLILLALLAASGAVIATLSSRNLGIAAAIVLTAADLCYFDLRVIRTATEEECASTPWYDEHIGLERDAYRLCDFTTTDASPAASGFRLFRGYGYPRPAALPTAAATDDDALERMNVRWIVASGPAPSPRWKEVGRRDGRVLYENPDARRMAFMMPTEHTSPTELQIKRTANSVEVEGRTYQAEKLVVAESWMPGWKAYLQRREVPIAKAYDSLLAVDVPAGDWYVILRYEPDAYRLGRLISSTAVAALIGLLIAGMRRSKIAIS